MFSVSCFLFINNGFIAVIIRWYLFIFHLEGMQIYICKFGEDMIKRDWGNSLYNLSAYLVYQWW